MSLPLIIFLSHCQERQDQSLQQALSATAKTCKWSGESSSESQTRSHNCPGRVTLPAPSLIKFSLSQDMLKCLLIWSEAMARRHQLKYYSTEVVGQLLPRLTNTQHHIARISVSAQRSISRLQKLCKSCNRLSIQLAILWLPMLTSIRPHKQPNTQKWRGFQVRP